MNVETLKDRLSGECALPKWALDWFDEMSDEQWQFCLHVFNPNVVDISCESVAGSGKTSAISKAIAMIRLFEPQARILYTTLHKSRVNEFVSDDLTIINEILAASRHGQLVKDQQAGKLNKYFEKTNTIIDLSKDSLGLEQDKYRLDKSVASTTHAIGLSGLRQMDIHFFENEEGDLNLAVDKAQRWFSTVAGIPQSHGPRQKDIQQIFDAHLDEKLDKGFYINFTQLATKLMDMGICAKMREGNPLSQTWTFNNKTDCITFIKMFIKEHDINTGKRLVWRSKWNRNYTKKYRKQVWESVDPDVFAIIVYKYFEQLLYPDKVKPMYNVSNNNSNNPEYDPNSIKFVEMYWLAINKYNDKEHWSKVQTYHYIFSDEAQDDTPARDEYLEHLRAPGGKRIRVGDSDQCLNYWSGSLPNFIQLARPSVEGDIISCELKHSFRCPERHCRHIRDTFGIDIHSANNTQGTLRHLEFNHIYEHIIIPAWREERLHELIIIGKNRRRLFPIYAVLLMQSPLVYNLRYRASMPRTKGSEKQSAYKDAKNYITGEMQQEHKIDFTESNMLYITSIHKAQGIGKPTVIILGTDDIEDYFHSLDWQLPDTDLGGIASTSDPREYFKDPFTPGDGRLRNYEALQARNMAYVAASRSSENLIFCKDAEQYEFGSTQIDNLLDTHYEWVGELPHVTENEDYQINKRRQEIREALQDYQATGSLSVLPRIEKRTDR